MPHELPAFRRFALACLLLGRTVSAVPVPPNPNSLLKSKRVLVYNGVNLSLSHPASRANAAAKLQLIKSAVGISSLTVMDSMDNATLATLNNYDIIVFNYVFESQKLAVKPFGAAFKQWLAAGNRGFVGYHTSGANEPGEWDWYRDSVTSMRYHVHMGPAQEGKLTITTDTSLRKQPILAGMPATFTGEDEWYDFDLKPAAPAAPTWSQCKVIYYVDESTLAIPPGRPMNPHPMAWFREDASKNRFFYAGFFHSEQGSNSDFFHSMLLRALEQVAGYQGSSHVKASAPGGGGGPEMSARSGRLRIEVREPGRHEVDILTTEGKIAHHFSGLGFQSYDLVLRRAGTAHLARITTPRGTFSKLIPVQ